MNVFARSRYLTFALVSVVCIAVMTLPAKPASAQHGTNALGNTVTLSSGQLFNNEQPSSLDGFDNYGTVTVNGAQFVHDIIGLDNIGSGATATINSGTFQVDTYGVENAGGTLIINGGAFHTNSSAGVFNNGGTTTINGGDFRSNTGYSFVNAAGTTNIYGGSFDASTQGDLSITGGTVDVYGTFTNYGKVTTSSGTFTGTQNGSAVTYSYNITGSGSLYLLPPGGMTPEPSGTITLTLGMVFLFGLTLIRQRHLMRQTPIAVKG